ncbi:unnamed protein product [Closterium sp. NIES-64]|nr:unnamed protein product [Closterium sp. NIES-64]
MSKPRQSPRAGPEGSPRGAWHIANQGEEPRQGEEAGLGRAGEVTVEIGALGDEAAAAGRAGENSVAGTVRVAAVVPRTAAATVPEVFAAAASAVETVADPVHAGGSTAAFGGGSTSPSAAPRVAQSEAEEPSPGADQEQTAEAALSALPAPVTAAVLAAAVSAATGKQGGAPTAEDVMIAAASAETPVAAVAANSHGRRCHSSLGSAGHCHVGSSKGRPYAVDAGGESGTGDHSSIGASGGPGSAWYGPRKARGRARGCHSSGGS